MNLTNEFDPIRAWAEAKGIFAKGNLKTQTLKLQEEAGELAKAVIEQKSEEIKDAIGDCVVVLTSVAAFAGFSIEDCINSSYNVIKDRTGRIENNTFIKDQQ